METKEYITNYFQPKRRYIFADDYHLEYVIKVKNTEKNLSLLYSYKEEHETDYFRCEYDCTGSEKREYKIKVRHGFIIMHCFLSIDL